MVKQQRHQGIDALLLFLVTAWQVARLESFVIQPQNRQQRLHYQFVSSSSRLAATIAAPPPPPPSKVEDPDGPTPEPEEPNIPIVDPETIDELKEITRVEDLHVAVPGQPWRRGDTAGCDAPIHAEWRRNAERVIEFAVEYVGGKVLDITWFLTVLLVTIDEDVMPQLDFLKDRGPVIEVREPFMPVYHDPENPDPEPINTDEDPILYIRDPDEIEDEQTAAERRTRTYAPKDADDDPNEPHIPASSEDSKMDPPPWYLDSQPDIAAWVAQQAEERAAEKPMRTEDRNLAMMTVDTKALSTIAQAIMDALEPNEEEWNILSRHELMLASPNPMPDVIETQKQFDAYREHHVIVETFDPFGSNRTLKGQLVDRNAMDLLLNIKGRLVTVPLVFVKCVRLPPQSYDYEDDMEDGKDEEDEMEVDGELVEAIPNEDIGNEAVLDEDSELMP